MNAQDLVKWLMEQDKNWMSKESLKKPSYYFMAQTATRFHADFFDVLNTIQTQPPLPLGEWFTPTTKHAFCFGCGEWVAVEKDSYDNYHCSECSYCVATYGGDDKWGADGDTDEYVWDSDKGMYRHIEDTEQDYPAPARPPEWVMATHDSLQHPTPTTLFDLANEVDHLPTNELALRTLRGIDAWLNSQPQAVFESMGTGLAYAMQKAIQALKYEKQFQDEIEICPSCGEEVLTAWHNYPCFACGNEWSANQIETKPTPNNEAAYFASMGGWE